MGSQNAKKILDSVHGYITIEKELFDNIIDTPIFQRLRRIEQTSTRTLFPTARHDRFSHSLGVYHLGCCIVQAICKTNDYPHFPANKEIVFSTYKLACLLHDVGHAPFSHTFEDFYDNETNNLSSILTKELDSTSFSSDTAKYLHKAASHEKMSAIISLRVFKNYIEKNSDKELFVRMITGCKYYGCKNKSFENAFIDLIHGEIIDADGLDYVERDSWSSGCYTAHVDLDRMISSIRIHKNKDDDWEVCYSPKCLNEIEAVLSIKNHQQQHLFTHHTIVYERELLKKAMESSALHHFSLSYSEDKETRVSALEKLCDINSLHSVINLPAHQIPLQFSDDDSFISLMKYIPDDKYVKQWLSRKYELVPLWKSTAEFFTFFPQLHKLQYSSKCWLFSTKCQEYLSDYLEINKDEIWIVAADSKDKRVKASQVKFLINDTIIPYADVYAGESGSFDPNRKPFAYIYIPSKFKEQIPKINEDLSKQMELFLFG